MKRSYSRRVLMAGLVAVLATPAAAFAAHTFEDVPDTAYYAEPVEWAYDNGITTGKSSTSFAPDDPVTRGESVTFLQRYDTNIVQPKFDQLDSTTAGLESRVAANEAAHAANTSAAAANTSAIESNDTDIADLAAQLVTTNNKANANQTAISERVQGFTDISLAPDATITGTTFVSIATVTQDSAETRDVAITAHVTATRTATNDATYMVTIQDAGCGGSVFGSTIWYSDITSGVDTMSIALTGFAPNVPAGADVALCVAKTGGGDDNLTIANRTMTLIS